MSTQTLGTTIEVIYYFVHSETSVSYSCMYGDFGWHILKSQKKNIKGNSENSCLKLESAQQFKFKLVKSAQSLRQSLNSHFSGRKHLFLCLFKAVAAHICYKRLKPSLHIVVMDVSTVANMFLILFQAVLIHVNT